MNIKTKFNPYARRKARRLALQALYQWEHTKQAPSEIIAQFLCDQEAIKADLDYFAEIVKQVIEHQERLDQDLLVCLDRTLPELDPIELTILRMSSYELLYRSEIPYKVVLNEAIELAKLFGATDGHKYVNGVLDRLAHRARAVEMSDKHE
jgi:N utilization substance protein B